MRPNPEGWVSPYPNGHTDAKVEAITDCLASWFRALEDGTAAHRMPDPSYQRRGGKPSWTEEELTALVNAIDADVDRELNWARANTAMLCTAGPEFHRLLPAQRLAMAQQLDAILAQYPDVPKAEPPHAPLGSVGYEY